MGRSISSAGLANDRCFLADQFVWHCAIVSSRRGRAPAQSVSPSGLTRTDVVRLADVSLKVMITASPERLSSNHVLDVTTYLPKGTAMCCFIGVHFSSADGNDRMFC